MKELRLNVGDTLVFDHSDYTDYGIVYAVSEKGSEAHAAFVDDGGGEDCLWLMKVHIKKENAIITNGGYEAKFDDSVLDDKGGYFGQRLVELVDQAAHTPEDVSLFPDDDMNEDDELSVLSGVFDTLLANKKFRKVYDYIKATAGYKEMTTLVPEDKKDDFAKELKVLCDKYNAKCSELRQLLPITERVKTFEDACEELGEHDTLVAQYHEIKGVLEGYSIEKVHLLAYQKLVIITAALNEGWKPTFDDDEYRWFPWFRYFTNEEVSKMTESERQRRGLPLVGANADDGATAGLGYVYSYNAWTSASAAFGSRLAYKTEELADYSGRQFKDIWEKYVGKF